MKRGTYMVSDLEDGVHVLWQRNDDTGTFVTSNARAVSLEWPIIFDNVQIGLEEKTLKFEMCDRESGSLRTNVANTCTSRPMSESFRRSLS